LFGAFFLLHNDETTFMADGHWDVIVVGSGFGGSVLAYRLAKAGYRVCLLERGKAYPPNSFPRSPIDMRNNFWDPSHGLYGLNNVWSFRGSAALVSSGLGGGSLIYANVLLRKDAKWFDGWPITRAELDPHYDAVERMMNVQQYPIHLPPFDQTHKATEFREAAIRAGHEPIPLNLAVSFRVHPVADPDHPDDIGNPAVVGEPIQERPNLHGMTRNTCRLCGECDIGCNYGSKNTLDFTYLTEAKRLGVEIRTLAQVETIAPRADGKGYDVSYVAHDLANQGRKLTRQERLARPRVSLSCDRLILAAGTMGTTFLLMSNRDNLPNLSPTLGTGYSTNGDDLAFFLDAEKELKPDFGPVITTAVRYPDTQAGGGEVGRGFYVEDGGNPYLFSWVAELSGVLGLIWRLVRFVWLRLKYLLRLSTTTDMGYQLAGLIGSCTASSHAMPVLAMGRDTPSGRFTLKDGVLDCDWTRRRSRTYYHRVALELRKLARGMNARYLENPFSRFKPFEQVLTAHPLGGCPMGRSRKDGVVDSWGEVFGHPGLYVADGSAMPGPTGTNPSLTIAAFADRVADGIIKGTPGHKEHETPMDDNTLHGPTVWFSEQMNGFAKPGETVHAAARSGKPLAVDLTIRTESLDLFLLDPKHRGSINNGFVRYAPAGDGKLRIESGEVELLADTSPGPDEQGRYNRALRYRLFFEGRDGPLTLSGIKKVHPVPTPRDKAMFVAWSLALPLFAAVRAIAARFNAPPFLQGPLDAAVLCGLGWLMALFIGWSATRLNKRDSFITEVGPLGRGLLAVWVGLLAGYTIFSIVAAKSSAASFLPPWQAGLFLAFDAAIAVYIGWTERGAKQGTFIGGLLSLWRDTTTLVLTIFQGRVHSDEEHEATTLATGVIRIGVFGLIRQLFTFASDAPTFLARCSAIFRFNKFFLLTLWDLFSAERQEVSDRQLKRGANAIGYQRPIARYTLEGVKNCDISTHPLTTDDDLGLNILRFRRKPCRDVVVLLHGLTTSTDMFIMPEHRNLVSYLLDNGYTDVWSFDWRGSMRYSYDLFPTDFTMDDIAQNDMPTAFSHIRNVVGPDARIHVICHCVGSLTFMMALYAQKVTGIASVISNSVSLTPSVPLWSRIKLTAAPWIFSRSPALNPRWAYYPGLFTYGKILAKLISLWHRLLGDCPVSACHMVSFMWGSGHPATWLHENISDVTHERTGDLFGAVNFAYYRHIRKMVSRGRAVKMYPNDRRYKSLPDEYLKNASAIDTPVFFVTGDTNHEFLDSNVRTFHLLNKLKPGNRNQVRIFKGYSHQDVFMGDRVADEIFPTFLEWLRSH
jgi:cholesterol oxidase